MKCPDHPDAKTLSKKLPGTMTVQKLKGLLQRLYKVDSSNQSLSYLDEKVRNTEKVAICLQMYVVCLLHPRSCHVCPH